MEVKYSVKVQSECAFTDYKMVNRRYKESENFYFKTEQEAECFIKEVLQDYNIILKDRIGTILNIEMSRIEKLKIIEVGKYEE